MSKRKIRLTISTVDKIAPLKGREDIVVALINSKPYVVRKDTFTEGAHAVVIMPGTVIGLDHPYYDFLSNKKGIRRVRKMRFKRGLLQVKRNKDREPILDENGDPILVGNGVLSSGVALPYNEVLKTLKESGIDIVYSKTDGPEKAIADGLKLSKWISPTTLREVNMLKGMQASIDRRLKKLLTD